MKRLNPALELRLQIELTVINANQSNLPFELNLR
jgi:hypothetical protein